MGGNKCKSLKDMKDTVYFTQTNAWLMARSCFISRCLSFFVFVITIGFLNGQSSSSPVLKAWESLQENKEESQFSGLNWKTLGPVINSGRVEALAVVPDDINTIYAAFGSGNLWKTKNHGLSWDPIFDNHAAYSIGDIAIAPSNSDVIYVGTGESLRAKRGHTIPGAGVYKSEDAGDTWTAVGLSNTHHIGRVAVHPENSDIVFVAALGSFYSPSSDRGIYKSKDGGDTWEKVLYTDERVGGNDVIFSPSDPNILYASTWYCSEDKAGPGGSIYKSTDGGETWEKKADGFPSGQQNGRTGLAVSFQNSEKVYAFTDNVNAGYKNGTAELYLTEDGGKRWKKTHSENLKILNTFGEVFTDCFVNPQDDNEVYVLGVAVMRSINAGKDFEMLRGSVRHLNPSPADYFHLDHHDMWIDPNNPDHIIVGNDGGVYESYDFAEHWMHYNNMPVGEFYFVRTDNDEPYRIYSGTQDDSSVRGPARTLHTEVPDDWEYVWIDPWSGGDGIVVSPDREDSDIVYYESQNGAIRRKKMSTGETERIKPKLPENYAGELYNEWLTPFFTSIHQSETLYYGSNYVFKSSDRGGNWEIVSPDLSLSTFDDRQGNGVIAIEESRIEQGLLFAGTSKGAAWVSRDDGTNWKEVSAGLSPKYIKSFAPSKFKKSRVYCAQSGIGEDDLTAYLSVSEDYGATWNSIVSNLPNAPINVILEDPNFENVLYCGTFNGVFVSEDRGESWHVLGSGLPNSFVADLTIQERDRDLIAATHGRGLYKIDLEALYAHHKLANEMLKILYISEATLPSSDASGGKPDLTSYENVEFSFRAFNNGPAEISVIDSTDQVIWEDEIITRIGINTYSWDLIVGPNYSDNPYLYEFFIFPDPGTYMISIRVGDAEMSSRFVVQASEE